MIAPMPVRVRAAASSDRPALQRFLERWHSLRVARQGALVHPLDHPILLAEDGTELIGALTYVIADTGCEVLTLHTDRQWSGIGTALLAEVERIARAAGCTRLWLITTNDNVDALRFYQRRGFRLAELHRGAVDDCRARLKPEIPATGSHGIPIRDELVLEQELVPHSRR
jgi:ribosomal protein S18 acetylase RimI-like enzyme